MRRLATFAALSLAAYAPFAAALDQNAAAPSPKGRLHNRQGPTPASSSASATWGFRRIRAGSRVSTRSSISIPARLAASRVNVTIDPRSIQADNAPSGFLDSLAGKDWLDAAKFPAMSFRSTSVELTERNSLRIHGDLTLHGVTKPIVLDARYNGGYAGHPMEPRARIGFSARGIQAIGFRRELRHPRSRHHDGRQRRSRGDSRNGVHGTAAPPGDRTGSGPFSRKWGVSPFPGCHNLEG